MTKPKILLYDIETFPNIGYTWAKWEQNVIKFVREWELASFAYKWSGDKSVICLSRRTHTEKQLTIELRKLMDEADITIAHNGDSFDRKKARAKFIQFGLKPTALNRTVDTKKIAKSQFAFNSNSLNDLGETLGLGKKVDTGGFDLWLGCMNNDKASWAKMEAYNKQDVVLLEKVYEKLKPWASNHPNVATLRDAVGCPICGSEKVQARGFTVSAKRRAQRYQCTGCAGWFTGKAL
jgi:hypothetical protein